MFKRLLLWLMLFVLPLQAIAANGAFHCLPLSHEQSCNVSFKLAFDHDEVNDHEQHAPPHSDSASTAESIEGHGHGHDHESGADSSSSHHKTSCCSSGLAFTASALTVPLLPSVSSNAIPYDVGPMLTVFLEGPRRPPRFFLL